LKASLDVVGCNSLEVGRFEGNEELQLGNMCDVGFDEIFEFATIGMLEGTKAPDIKRLSKMRRVCRKAEGDDVVCLAVLFELRRYVAYMAVENNYPIDPMLLGFCMLVEVRNPLYSCLIVCLAVCCRLDNLRGWKVILCRL